MATREESGRPPGPDILKISMIAVFFLLPILLAELIWIRIFIPLAPFYLLTTTDEGNGNRILAAGLMIAGLFALATHMLPAFLISLTLLPPGYTLARAVKYKYPASSTWLASSLTLLTTWAAGLILLALFSQQNPYTGFITVIDEAMVAAGEVYQQANLTAEQAFQLERTIKGLRDTFPLVFPSFLLITIITIAWLNLLTGDWLLKKYKPGLSPWPDFKTWRLPEQMVWLAVFAGCGIILPAAGLKVLCLNLALIAGCLYFIQGLAILSFFLEKWNIARPLRIFIYFMIIIQVYGIIFLALAGLFDIWIDFRKKKVAQA